MITRPRTRATRERIVTEAIRLFARHGFSGTTVGDIEQAAGLAPRAGGLYKHFRSKEEVLSAAIERHVREMERMRARFDVMPLGDLRAELTLAARWALAELREEQLVMKVVQKDGDRFPELVARGARADHRARPRAGRAHVRAHVRRAGIEGRDPRAIAAVALGALVDYRLEETMFGVPAGGRRRGRVHRGLGRHLGDIRARRERCRGPERRSDGTHRGEEQHDVRMANWYTRRSYGRDTEIAGVMAHSPPNFRGYGMFEWFHERSQGVDEKLKALAGTKAACLIGCEFCLDIGSHISREAGVTEEQLRSLHAYRESPAFSPLERLVLEYAEEMCQTPVSISDELFARLREHFNEEQIVELTTAIAIENFRARFNRRARTSRPPASPRASTARCRRRSRFRRRSARRRSRRAPTRTPRSGRASRSASVAAAAAGSSNRPNAAGPEPDSAARLTRPPRAAARAPRRASGSRSTRRGLEVVVEGARRRRRRATRAAGPARRRARRRSRC